MQRYRIRLTCHLMFASAIFGLATTLIATPTTQPASKPAAATTGSQVQISEADVTRYRKLVTDLSAPEMEGRGPGTKGREKARDYIVEQFKAAGLKPVFRAKEGATPSYLQPFEIPLTIEVEEPKLAIRKADSKQTRTFEHGEHYRVIGSSPSAKVSGTAVWAGYGVKNEEEDYDSYTRDGKPLEKDALKGKIAVCFRYEPQEKGKSQWTQGGWSSAAYLTSKIQEAEKHGAAALIFVNPPSQKTQPMQTTAGSIGPKSKIPMIQVSLDAFHEMLSRAGFNGEKKARELQAEADKGSTDVVNWDSLHIELNIRMKQKSTTVENVAGVLPGQGKLKDEYLVIGGHYDHLGFGGRGSLSPGKKAIHHGADDNASGTAGVIMLAEHFARLAKQPTNAKQDRRSIIFAGFDAEERGLIGSGYMTRHFEQLGIEAKQIKGMFNFDMIGRMRDDRLMVWGVGSGDEWKPLIDAAAKAMGLDIREGQSGYGPSDHTNFYQQKIPVLFFFTGRHNDYHSPSDTADKVNAQGGVKVVNFASSIVERLWIEPVKLAYVAPKPGQRGMRGSGRGSRVLLGIMPDYGSIDREDGCKIGNVRPGTPAAKAGMKDGDVIVKWGKKKISNLNDLTAQLAKHKPGDKVKVIVKRGDEAVGLDIKLIAR